MKFGKPQRTTHTVFVPIEGPRVRFLFPDISNIAIRPSARTPGGFTVTARFPINTWAGEQLDVLDAESLAATLTHNKLWFKNGLTEDHIHEFFEPSLEVAYNSVRATFHISPTHSPLFTDMSGNSTSLDAFFEQWSSSSHKGKDAITASATVDVVGILFEKKRFRLRLMLRALEAHASTTCASEDFLPDRRELEEHWRAEINAVINPKIAAQEKTLQELESIKKQLLQQIDAAERTPDCKIWDGHLATIAQTLRYGNILHRI